MLCRTRRTVQERLRGRIHTKDGRTRPVAARVRSYRKHKGYPVRESGPDVRGMDLEALRLLVQGLAGRVIAVEGEVTNLRSQLVAVIAERQP